MYQRISDQARAERLSYEGEITLPSGDSFDFRKTVKMIYYHSQSKFFENDDENDVFYSLGGKRVPHFVKKIDTDSKDYEVTGEGDDDYATSWVANIKLRTWFRDSGFALDLNDLTEHCAEYGSTVMKLAPTKDGNELKTCNLLHLWFDPSVENIKDSPIIELHQLTEYQIRKMKGWDKVDKAIEVAEQMNNQETPETIRDNQIVVKYKIWERCGEFQRRKPNNEGDGEIVYLHTIFTGYGDNEVILFEEELDKESIMYFDFHLSKYADRWLRIGVYERLFGLQRLVNELVNHDRESSAIASLILLKSRDKALIGRNVLEESFSGMILDNQDLSQVGIDNRSLNEFLAKLSRYEIKADELCMTPDILTGERLPSGATFRGQALSMNNVTDAFKNARDRIGFRMAEFLLKKKLPELMKKWNTEDVLEITSADEEAKIFDYFGKKYVLAEYIKSVWAKGENPTQDDINNFMQRIEQEWEKRSKKLAIKGLFTKFKYGLKLNPTGENINKEQRNEVYSNALQMLSANPLLANNALFQKYLEDNGISPIKIPLEEIQNMQDQNAQGGASKIPAPQPKMDKLMATVNH